MAEALLQLALSSEFSGDKEAAEKSYRRLVADFPKNPKTPKAQGALRRLSAVGKPIELKGPDVSSGSMVDLGQYKGKAVLIHYW